MNQECSSLKPTVEATLGQGQSVKGFSVDESFINAPSTFSYPTPTFPHPTSAEIHRHTGSINQSEHDELISELYDPSIDDMWSREARGRRARSHDSPPRLHHLMGNQSTPDNERTRLVLTTETTGSIAPRPDQLGHLNPSLAQNGSITRQPQPVNIEAPKNTSCATHADVPIHHSTPRNVNLLPGARDVPVIQDLTNLPRAQLPSHLSSTPTSSEHQREQVARNRRPPHRPHRTPRSQVVDTQSHRSQRGALGGRISDCIPRNQGQRQTQRSVDIIPPGELMRAMQNGVNPFQSPYLVGNEQRLQPYPQSPYALGNSNPTPQVPGWASRGYAPAYYGRPDADLANKNIVFNASGQLVPEKSDTGCSANIPKGPRSSTSDFSTPGTRKRPLLIDDESDEEKVMVSLLEEERGSFMEDEEEDATGGGSSNDETGEDKKSLTADVEPPKKKPKATRKKTTERKSKPPKRKTKARKNHGELETREDGSIWFRANEEAPWESTIRHEPNRAAMVADARQNPADPDGERSYDVAPAGGPTDQDRTSYLDSQRHWYYNGPHDWHHPTLDPIFYRFQRSEDQIRTDDVGPLRWHGHIVLNNNDNVISDWPDMPLTLSSKLEGWRMEGITRLDDRVSAEEFRDRMPTRKGKNGLSKPPQVTSALGNQRSRFREANGLASWEARDGTSGFTEAIQSRLSQQQRDNNTTEGFDRLSQETIDRIREDNRAKAGGAYARRAGQKALTEEERQARVAGKKPKRSKRSKSNKRAEENLESRSSAQTQQQRPESLQSNNSQESITEDDGDVEGEEDVVYDADDDYSGQ